MILFPIRTDSPVRHVPYVNYALIAINILIFFVLDVLGTSTLATWGEQAKTPLMLWPAEPLVLQFISYQFLHGDSTHLLGNMFFLWLFGNSVNGKMGHLTYLLFYLAGGAFAGLGFAAAQSATPCLGASGSVAAVTTAYLVLFPRSQVTVFYWFFIYIGTMEIGSILWIGGKMIVWDNYLAMNIKGQYTNVAFEAHLAGYFCGFSLALLMLWIRALPRDQYDVLALFKRWYQRSTYRAAMQNPNTRARAQYGRVSRNADELPQARPASGAAGAAEVVEASGPAAALRTEIGHSIYQNDFNTAADKYMELIAMDASQVLPRRQQLDVANQLMTLSRFPQAADAYEKYLTTYPRTPEAEQVSLLLGILYARYLQRYDLARKHLGEALTRLTNPQQRNQAQHWLDVSNQPPSPPADAQPAS
ncbi:MAG: rhomboid family intramembrane serine protease [Phycisphaerae bacterium]